MTPIKDILFDYEISIFLIMKDSFEIINSQSDYLSKTLTCHIKEIIVTKMLMHI